MISEDTTLKILCLSDTHGEHWKLGQLPEADMLIHAGDLTNFGSREELLDVNVWLGTLPYRYKLIIGGNHDQQLQEIHGLGKQIFTNATYLEDEAITIDGITFYASPTNNIEGDDWAFNDNPQKRAQNIPSCDILITHAPPYGILDMTTPSPDDEAGLHVGDIYLLKAVAKRKPAYHIFGHIHAGYGTYTACGIIFYNVALQNDRGELLHNGRRIREPVLIEFTASARKPQY